MKHSRRYWESHHGGDSPLLLIHSYLKALGRQPDSGQIRSLAERVSLPEATVRGVISYYSDLVPGETPIRVCKGTSCMLSGGADLQHQLHGRCKGVYCLGYCDQSPALLDSHDIIHVGKQAFALAAGAPQVSPHTHTSIRSIAPIPIVTRRLGSDYSRLGAARQAECYQGLGKALQMAPADVLTAVESSGERGRGGAGFPTGTKWRRCAEAKGDIRYVIANGDEGDPGSFVDRMLMENDPHGIIEGMLICAYAIGAAHGIVFIRSEYPKAIERMRTAIIEAQDAGLFQLRGAGRDIDFELFIFPGMGSYVCGEETALLSAIEGLRGEVQIRPPYPTDKGLYGKPTVVNNVETLVNIAAILDMGSEVYRAMGTTESAGTKVLCLNNGFARPGLLEVEFGTSLRAVIEEAGGGAGGRRIEGVILGGPMGSLVFPDQWDVPICYGAMSGLGIQLGHGGLIALHEGADYHALLAHWMQFMMDESCGKCVPCRLGSRAAWKCFQTGEEGTADSLHRLFNVMEQGSLCAFGQFMPGPMRQMIDHFGYRIFENGGCR